MHRPKRLIIIAGPTAVGKTEVALQVASALKTEIISADSRQCYREMTIGTAKPSAIELARVRHYFINSHSITQELNAADYEQLALGYCENIFQEKDTAVLCGGTGLYIKALCEGIDPMPATDREIEGQLQQDYDTKGIAWLQQKVLAEDPDFYTTSEQQNPARLIRALAFKLTTGQSITCYRSGQIKERPFHIVKVALDLPRPALYERINARVDIMMEQGLLTEARELYPLRQLKNLHTVGYTELFDYMDGRHTLEESIILIKQHSRNYAKRQLTWFRKDEQFRWFEPGNITGILDYINGTP